MIRQILYSNTQPVELPSSANRYAGGREMLSKFRLFSSFSSFPWLSLSAGLFTWPLYMPTVSGLAGGYGCPQPSLTSAVHTCSLRATSMIADSDTVLVLPAHFVAKIVYSTDSDSGCGHHPLLKLNELLLTSSAELLVSMMYPTLAETPLRTELGKVR